MPERTPDSPTRALTRPESGLLAGCRRAVKVIAATPENEIWLASLKNEQTRRAYRRDVQHFVGTLGVRSLNRS